MNNCLLEKPYSVHCTVKLAVCDERQMSPCHLLCQCQAIPPQRQPYYSFFTTLAGYIVTRFHSYSLSILFWVSASPFHDLIGKRKSKFTSNVKSICVHIRSEFQNWLMSSWESQSKHPKDRFTGYCLPKTFFPFFLTQRSHSLGYRCTDDRC